MNGPTPKELSAQLARDPERLCRRLLPHGKLLGGEWCVGSLSGEAGQSLKVRCGGDKAGIWADFAGQDKGDLLDLIAAQQGLTLGKAMAWARDFLGLASFASVAPTKTYRPLKPPTEVKALKPGPVADYLTAKRMLTAETLKQFRVSETAGEIAFPSFSPEGVLLNIKYIGIERDAKGKKVIRQETGCAPSLFGWQAFPKEQRDVVITEGQIDAMTWAQLGFPALSMPDGVGSLDGWIDFEWDNLQRFDTIYLSFDDDKPGQEAVNKVALRLGRHRCVNVKLPHKDANDALLAGLDLTAFAKCAVNGTHFTPGEIKSPMDFVAGVIDKFFPPDGTPPGFFPVLLGRKMGFRPGEVTVWTGISSHGKSALISQLMVVAMKHGSKVAIASMEMSGVQTLYRMTCQVCDTQSPSRETIVEQHEWLAGKLWIFDILGNVEVKKLSDLMDYSHARFGVNHFVIDSLMKVGVGSEDYDGQRSFLNTLTGFAQRTGAHVHLVAHARKGKDETNNPGKMDVAGSGNIINQADNILSVWRNKDKEEKARAGKLTEREEKSIPDTKVFCMKQRENGVEFEEPLQFNPQTYMFFRNI